MKVHAKIEKGLADEQSVLCGFILLLSAPSLLLAVSFFSNCMAFPMRTIWPARQCCQEPEISATKHLDFLTKISTGITINWFG
jgi:hypothetical protein